MTADETSTPTLPANQNGEILDLLNLIMAMSDHQRLKLGKAWAAMDPVVGLELFQRDAIRSEEHDGQDLVVDKNAVAELSVWIAEQQALQPRERLASLQEALDHEGEEWAVTLLDAEIAKVKNSHLLLAAELAVVKYAYDHPVLIIVALSGLGFGLYRFGKTLFALVF